MLKSLTPSVSNRETQNLTFMSQINLLTGSLSSASDGSVFQSDGKNRQGEEDVISDTVHVAGRHRPEIGECLVLGSPKSFLMLRLALSQD